MFDLSGETEDKTDGPQVDILRDIIVSSAKDTAFKKVNWYNILKLCIKKNKLYFDSSFENMLFQFIMNNKNNMNKSLNFFIYY